MFCDSVSQVWAEVPSLISGVFWIGKLLNGAIVYIANLMDFFSFAVQVISIASILISVIFTATLKLKETHRINVIVHCKIDNKLMSP